MSKYVPRQIKSNCIQRLSLRFIDRHCIRNNYWKLTPFKLERPGGLRGRHVHSWDVYQITTTLSGHDFCLYDMVGHLSYHYLCSVTQTLRMIYITHKHN